MYAAFSGRTAEIVAYAWKSHVMLNEVAIDAAGRDQPTSADGRASFGGIADTSLALTAARAVPLVETAATAQAVNLQDAIAVLKLIVGLDVNGSDRPFSPYQAYAADFDGDGAVNLSDAIKVLKHVVGLDAPAPAWTFFDEAAATTVSNPLQPGHAPAIAADLSAASVSVPLGLVGVLRGDVDGSFAGVSGAPLLPGNYFTEHGLDPARFGIYP